VGFWGVKIAVRTDRSLDGLPLLSQIGGDEDGSWVEPSGWIVASRHRADEPPPRVVAALAEQAAGPALIAYVEDSDVVMGYGARPGLIPFAFILNPARAAAYDLSSTPDEQALDAADLVGLVPETADAQEVAKVLGQDWMFAEDAFLALLCALGVFDRPRLGELVFGPMPEDAGG
jgi:hypothetical protein